MKSDQLKDNFYPFMKVSLGSEHGVVTDDYWKIADTHPGKAVNAELRHYGVIRWDTNKEADYEDWRGLWGTFSAMGGHQIEQEYRFKFINNDGTFKGSIDGDFRVNQKLQHYDGRIRTRKDLISNILYICIENDKT